MDQFFVKDWSGEAFILFGPGHLAALGVVAVVILLLPLLRGKPRLQVIFRYSLAALLIVDELMWHWWNWSIGQWTVQTMLPLHLCSIFVFLSAIMLVTRSLRIYEFAYFIGIGAAMQALLTPDAGQYGFPHFRAFQVMISHGSIMTAAIYMTLVEGYRPTWKSLGRVFLWTNVYMAAVFVLNQAIGSNYLFVAHKPETASLMDVLGPWPWYILAVEAIALVICLLLYLPFAVGDWRKTKKPVTA